MTRKFDKYPEIKALLDHSISEINVHSGSYPDFFRLGYETPKSGAYVMVEVGKTIGNGQISTAIEIRPKDVGFRKLKPVTNNTRYYLGDMLGLEEKEF